MVSNRHAQAFVLIRHRDKHTAFINDTLNRIQQERMPNGTVLRRKFSCRAVFGIALDSWKIGCNDKCSKINDEWKRLLAGMLSIYHLEFIIMPKSIKNAIMAQVTLTIKFKSVPFRLGTCVPDIWTLLANRVVSFRIQVVSRKYESTTTPFLS